MYIWLSIDLFMNSVIGREEQLEFLDDALHSNKSELVVVYGRRRVGKTFLIREAYKKHCVLEVSGIPDGSYKDQLSNFYNALCRKKKSFSTHEKPENWLEAFSMLSDFLDGYQSEQKKVVFLDEFPWMYTRRSKFVQFSGISGIVTAVTGEILSLLFVVLLLRLWLIELLMIVKGYTIA